MIKNKPLKILVQILAYLSENSDFSTENPLPIEDASSDLSIFLFHISIT